MKWVSREQLDAVSERYAKAESDALIYLERAVKAEAKSEAQQETISGLQRELMRTRGSLDAAETRHTELVTRLVSPNPNALQYNERAYMGEELEDIEYDKAFAVSQQALANGRADLAPPTPNEIAQELVRQAGGFTPDNNDLFE